MGEMVAPSLISGQFKRLEELSRTIESSEKVLSSAIAQLPDVFWYHDRPRSGGTPTFISKGFEKIFGVSRGELKSVDTYGWIEYVHEDDRQECLERIRRHFTEASKDPAVFHYRIVRPNGEVRSVIDRTYPVIDEDGQIVAMAGILTDVTDLPWVKASWKQPNGVIPPSRRPLRARSESRQRPRQ